MKGLVATLVSVLCLSAAPARVVAGASPCPLGCWRQMKACSASAIVSLRSCRVSCKGGADPAACRRSCVTTFRAATSQCQDERATCATTCPPPPPPTSCGGAFLDTCGQQLAGCAQGVIADAKACMRGCRTARDARACLQACASGAGAGVQECRTNFATCIIPCRPSTTTTLPGTACQTDADCQDGNGCTVDRCTNGQCEHVCICMDATASQSCCPGPAALCVRPTTTTLPGICGGPAFGTCGGTCPTGSTCQAGPLAIPCHCVSGPGGPCGGNIFAPMPVCGPGLTCNQVNPDVGGTCEPSTCIPLSGQGCAQSSDCCEPCSAGRTPPCAVCSQGTCLGAP